MNLSTSFFRIIICFVFLEFGAGSAILSGDMKAAADKTNDGASFKLDHAPTYMFPDQNLLPADTPGKTRSPIPYVKAGAALSPGLSIAQTTYDMQSSGTGGRKVAIDPFLYFVYLVWTCQSDSSFSGDRGVCLAGYDLTLGDISVQDATGSHYAGFATVGVQPGSGAAFSCNARFPDPDSAYRSRYYYDDYPGVFVFLYETPDSSRQTLWPQIATHDANYSGVTEDVVYVLAHDFPDGDDVYLVPKGRNG